MKKTDLKDSLRNIRKNLLSWISVIFIAGLAVSAYLGIRFSSAGMRNSGNEFYQNTVFRDCEITSTLLITEEDMGQLRSTQGVADVEGTYFTNGSVTVNDKNEAVSVVSVTERINIPVIVSGRLPQTDKECALEETVAENLGIDVGSLISVKDSEGGTPLYLMGTDYTVTGILHHPDHIGKPAQTPGNRYVVLIKEAFDLEKLGGNFMRAELIFDKPAGISYYSDEYFDSISDTMDRVKSLAEKREKLRYETLYSGLEKEIEENRQKLNDAKAELDKGRKQLDDGSKELENGKEQLSQAEQKLIDADKLLSDGKKAIEDGESKIKAKTKELEEAKTQYEEGSAAYDTAEAELDKKRAALDENRRKLAAGEKEYAENLGKYSEAKGKFDDSQKMLFMLQQYRQGLIDKGIDPRTVTMDEIKKLCDGAGMTVPEKYSGYKDINELCAGLENELKTAEASLTESRTALDAARAQLDTGWEQLDAGETAYAEADKQLREKKTRLAEGKAAIENGEAQLKQAKEQLEQKRKEFNDRLSEYNNGQSTIGEQRAKLEESGKALEQGEKDYRSNLDEYNKGVKALEEAESRLAGMKDCRWLLFDVNGNPGYAHLSSTSNSISSLSLTFSLFFMVIAALVIYTSVGRMIEEQRRLVGASKALGLRNREIMSKYMMFGVGATVIGIVLGIAGGYFVIQGVVLSAYKKLYVIGKLSPEIQIPLSAVILAAGTALAAAAVLLSCSKLMRSTAIELMQEKQPKTGRRRAGKAGSLYSRLIMRNIRSDMSRVIVTAVSVAGCCSLLVTGFTMRNNISGVTDIEYGQIIKYDEKVSFDPGRSADAEKQIGQILDEAGAEKALVYDRIHTYLGSGKLQTAELFCGDLDAFSEFYAMNDLKTGQPLVTGSEGVYIQSRTAEVFGFDTGDTFTMYGPEMEPYTVKVAGVFKNYLGYTMVMTDGYYEQIFGKPAEKNTFLLRADESRQEQIEEAVKKVEGFDSVSYCKNDINTMGTIVKIFTGLAGMMIIIAGLLAYFILLNINKMYISQKTTELTIMRINGFTVKEVKRYLLTETLVTTAGGIVLGIGVGSVMGYSVISSLEAPYLQFIRQVNLTGWLMAAVITLIFTLGINAIALRKIKHLKLTDVV